MIETLIVASWIVVAALYVPLVPGIVRSLRRRRQRRLLDGEVNDAVKGKEAA